MYKKSSGGSHRLRALALVPAFFAAAIVAGNPTVASAISSTAKAELQEHKLPTAPTADKVTEISETAQETVTLPQFPGGEAELYKFLANNIKYPALALEASEEGRVLVKFTVMENGRLADPHILQGVSKSLNEEAMRIVSIMPDWNPALNVGGLPVACGFVLPVNFKLNRDVDTTKKQESPTSLSGMNVVAH